MNRERLLKVVEVLETVESEQFEMSVWTSGLQAAHDDCGTVACAVGWYCLKRPNSGLDLKNGMPWTGSSNNWDAVQEHFDLSERDAAYLFNGARYQPDDDDEDWIEPTREEVIDRIRAFVASGGKRETAGAQ